MSHTKKNDIPTTYYCVSQVCVGSCKKLKVKQSLYRPAQGLRVPGVWGLQISRQSAHLDGKVVSHTPQAPLPPPLPQKISLVLISVRGWVNPRAIVRPEGCQWKIPVTPSGIELATRTLVVQCLNQLRPRVPRVRRWKSTWFSVYFMVVSTADVLLHDRNKYHNFGPEMKVRPSRCLSICSNSG